MRIIFLFLTISVIAGCNRAHFKEVAKKYNPLRERRTEFPRGGIPWVQDILNQSDPNKDERQDSEYDLKFSIVYESKTNPVNVLFIIDNSISMEQEFSRLKASITNFVHSLKMEGQSYNLRFIPMSNVVNIANRHLSYSPPDEPPHFHLSDGFAPTINGFSPPDFDTPLRRSAYNKILAFSNDSNLNVINDYLSKISLSGSIENGLCAGLDYLNFQSYRKNNAGDAFLEDGRFHLVFLSDEDNENSFRVPNHFRPLQGANRKYLKHYCFYDRQYTYKIKTTYVTSPTTEISVHKQCILEEALPYASIGYFQRGYLWRSSLCTHPERANPWVGGNRSGSRYCDLYETSICTSSKDGVTRTSRSNSSYFRGYSHCAPDTAGTVLSNQVISPAQLADPKYQPWIKDLQTCADRPVISCRAASLNPRDSFELVWETINGKRKLSEIKPTDPPCRDGFGFFDVPGSMNLTGSSISTSSFSEDFISAEGISLKSIPGSVRAKTNTLNMYRPYTKTELTGWFREKYLNGNTSKSVEVVETPTAAENSPEATAYEATPDSFMKAIAEFHAKKLVTAHAIVNQDGAPCEDAEQGDAQVSAGTSYMELADATGGVIGDICDPDFGDIMQKIVSDIKTDVKKTYTFDEINESNVAKVVNTTTSEEYVAERDYRIIGNTIVFTDGKINLGEEIGIIKRE